MSPFLLLAMIGMCATITLSDQYESGSAWFSYPIHKLASPSIQKLAKDSAKSLRNTNLFSIPNFLSPNTLQLLQNEILSLSDKVAWSEHYKTVYQDKGDDTFTMNDDNKVHPRNHMLLTKKGYLGRTDLSQIFIDIYNYKPLLKFLKLIVILGRHHSDLHLSNDKEGSIYGQIYRNGSVNGYHFDQHTFSCVWLLQKPLHQSGAFRYIKMENKNNKDWKILEDIFDGNRNDDILSYHPNEGDIVCFVGDTTLHGVDEIKGDRTRLAFVTAYSEFPNFKHTHHVNEFNTWGEHKNEL